MTVEDPELGLDIVSLGLVYEIACDDGHARIVYSLTSMGCPIGPMIERDIVAAASTVPGVDDVEAELRLRPAVVARAHDGRRKILARGVQLISWLCGKATSRSWRGVGTARSPSRAGHRFSPSLPTMGRSTRASLRSASASTSNTVRVHLTALIDAGLVEAETAPPRGRGRPRLTYKMTVTAPDDGGRRYRLLAEMLTALVARFGGQDATAHLEEIGADLGPPPRRVTAAVRRTVGGGGGDSARLAAGRDRLPAGARAGGALQTDPDAAVPLSRAGPPARGGRLSDPSRA